MTYRQIFPNISLLTNCPKKITISQADLRPPDIYRVRWPPIYIGLGDFDNSHTQWFSENSFFLYFLLLNLIRNMEYLISWLQKISLELATFWVRYFLRTYTFWKELVCLIFKSLLPFITFVNYQGPYFAEGFLHNLCPCFHIAFAQLDSRNKLFEILAVAECYFITNHVKI